MMFSGKSWDVSLEVGKQFWNGVKYIIIGTNESNNNKITLNKTYILSSQFFEQHSQQNPGIKYARTWAYAGRTPTQHVDFYGVRRNTIADLV